MLVVAPHRRAALESSFKESWKVLEPPATLMQKEKQILSKKQNKMENPAGLVCDYCKRRGMKIAHMVKKNNKRSIYSGGYADMGWGEKREYFCMV